ncbi:MAG: hypothetical protein EA383_10775 [Spirochaetaceae bacterium]|nr:MAG: hypothetical protein EA383_10775 [Spirochaetaceae bacterium]
MSEGRLTVMERIHRLLRRLVASVNPESEDRQVDAGPAASVSRRRSQLSRYKRSADMSETNAELYARLKRNRFSNVLDTYHILEHGRARSSKAQSHEPDGGTGDVDGQGC